MNDKIAVMMPDWLIPFWWKVAYLIIGPGGWRHEELAKTIQIQPDERFNKTVTKHLQAWVQKGVMPPEDIAPAILNLADDFLAGRQINIRAGDYIAIQNHLRRSK